MKNISTKKVLKMQSGLKKLQTELENNLIESEFEGLVITFNSNGIPQSVTFENPNPLNFQSKNAIKETEKTILGCIQKGITASKNSGKEITTKHLDKMGLKNDIQNTLLGK